MIHLSDYLQAELVHCPVTAVSSLAPGRPGENASWNKSKEFKKLIPSKQREDRINGLGEKKSVFSTA